MMKVNRNTLLALIVLNTISTAFAHDQDRPLQVITYNAALTRLPPGMDLVPCVNARLPAQLKALEKELRAPFVLNLQELFSAEVREAYRNWAVKRDYSVAWGVESYDLMTISSEPILMQKFQKYRDNDITGVWGIGLGRYDWGFGYLITTIAYDGRELGIINTHTAYSRERINPAQVSQLNELAKVTEGISGMPVILAGDLNAGPDVHIRGGEYHPVEEIWQREWVSRINPAWARISAGSTRVTWDDSHNLLVKKPADPIKIVFETKGGWGNLDSTLDHIFGSPEIEAVRTRVLLDEPVAIEGCETHTIRVAGERRGYLSDHYALETEVHVRAPVFNQSLAELDKLQK